MKAERLTLLVLLVGLVFTACKKEEPFEYPTDPESPNEVLNVYMERKVDSTEKWITMNSSDGCNPNVHINNLAHYELNTDRGFAVMQLVPDSTSCALEVVLRSDFKDAEVTQKWEWEDLDFEFTYSEFAASSGTELWISLYYKNLELDLDVAPYISSLVPTDTTNGLIKLSIIDNEPAFWVNGKKFTPEFGDASGNYFTLGGDGQEQFFRARMTSEGVDTQSYVAFKYMRITRFGIPD